MTYEEFENLVRAFRELDYAESMTANDPSVHCGCECGCGGDLFDYDPEEWDWQREQYYSAMERVRRLLAEAGVMFPERSVEPG